MTTKQDIIKAQCMTIEQLMLKVMLGATMANEYASKGEINTAMGCLMIDVAPHIETIKTLVDATLVIHQTMKEKDYE